MPAAAGAAIAANSIAPGRRPLTNMCPIIFRDGDAPVLAAGASGGRRLGADVQAALRDAGPTLAEAG